MAYHCYPVMNLLNLIHSLNPIFGEKFLYIVYFHLCLFCGIMTIPFTLT